MVDEKSNREFIDLLSRTRQLIDSINQGPPSPPPGQELMAELMGQTARKATEYYGLGDIISPGYAKTATKKLIKNEAKARSKAIKIDWYNNKNTEIEVLISQVRVLFSHCSVMKPDLPINGNSSAILNKLARIQGLKTPLGKANALTTLLHEINALGVISNEDIPIFLASMPSKEGNDAQVISKLERALRQYVKKKLEKKDPNWWDNLIPPSIQKNAESRKERREGNYFPPISTPTDLVSFVSFSDYNKIMLSNWECFSDEFPDKQWLSVQMKELETIRNDIMHSRLLSNHEKDKLKVISTELLAIMGKK